MPQIKVSEDTYKRLKHDADSQFRSLGGHIEYLIAMDELREIREYEAKAQVWMRSKEMNDNLPDEMQVHQDQLPLDGIFTSKRTRKDIQKEINILQAFVDSADYDNQDPDYWQEVNNKKEEIKKLWEEWHLSEA